VTESLGEHVAKTVEVLGRMAESLAGPAARAAEMMLETLRPGHTVYVCGNGGSASQAQHIAGELVGRFQFDRPALPCVALTADSSLLTAIANDYGLERIFERQVEALVREGDLLWALSTSGASANVLRAAAKARQRGARVVGMTGAGGGKLKALCDVALCVPADSAALVQEGHLALLHFFCGYVEASLFARPGEDRPA
jgi:D-sedoheptulose 7-phosphate isomerase